MINKAQTVRCFLIYNNSILFLRKAGTSRNPYKLEIPGGKIEDENTPREAVYNEILEETNIRIDISLLKELPELSKSYSFSARGEAYERDVAYFVYQLTSEPEISINNKPEDHHESFEWISITDYFGRLSTGEIGEFSENSIVTMNDETELQFR